MLNQQQHDKWLSVFQWRIPAILVFLVLVYQLGIARWIFNNIDHDFHLSIEVLFFSTSSPLLVYWTIGKIKSWLMEKAEAIENMMAITEPH